MISARLIDVVKTYSELCKIVDKRSPEFHDALYQLGYLIGNLQLGPKIICLVGSTKFKEQFERENFRLTMLGNIVLDVCWLTENGSAYEPTAGQKIKLDEIHKRKIDLSDEVFVINVGGYIGDSTKSEIEYAKSINVPVNYLEEL